jgi:hypothetical protein
MMLEICAYSGAVFLEAGGEETSGMAFQLFLIQFCKGEDCFGD